MKIYLFGYSGHSYTIIDAIHSNQDEVIGYFDKFENLINPYQIKYFGDEKKSDLKPIINENFVFPSIGDNTIRENIYQYFLEKNLNQINIIHNKSIISNTAKIGLSTFVNAGSIINSLSEIGFACIINTGAIVEHECKIGNYCHLAPGSVLAGNVSLGNNVFIGANAVIRQGLKIGNNVIVGAGSVVIKNIPNNEVWVGNPARKIK
jgi:sugar O-acyltransferase (sialic acid O-acetyltransferase NeuD family)